MQWDHQVLYKYDTIDTYILGKNFKYKIEWKQIKENNWRKRGGRGWSGLGEELGMWENWER